MTESIPPDDATFEGRGAIASLKRRHLVAGGAVCLAVVVALAGAAVKGRGRTRLGPGDEGGRVALVSIEGIGPADLGRFQLAERMGQLFGDPPMAYGIVWRAPQPDSESIWAEAMVGRFSWDKADFKIAPGASLWERVEATGRRAVIFPAPAPAEPRPPMTDEEAASIARADRERLEVAIGTWRDRTVHLVALRLRSAAAERLNGRELSGACSSIVEACVRDLVMAPGEDGTVFAFSSASTASGPETAREEGAAFGAVYLGPGVVVASGRGIGGRRWPAIARIADMTPTALYYLGVPLPGDLDGGVLWDLVDRPFFFHVPVHYAQG